MAKRSERSTSSSSTESPPSRRFKNDEMVNEKYSEPSVSLSHLLDKLNYLDKRLEDLFGNLSTELSTLRYELKEEIVGVKNNMAEMEKSVETAWAVIGEIQTQLKDVSDSKEKSDRDLESQQTEINRLKRNKLQMDNQRAEIDQLKMKLAEEQEKVIALETYSRRENLRFMNIPEQTGENCIDTVYDIIENELKISTDDIQFQAVHRVGKVRPAINEQAKASPRPIIARFLLREDRDYVLKAKNKLKKSEKYKDAYITQDYARAVQMERKTLIKAMFKAKEKGLDARVVNRNLIVDNQVFHVGNIPDDLKASY